MKFQQKEIQEVKHTVHGSHLALNSLKKTMVTSSSAQTVSWYVDDGHFFLGFE